MHDFAELARQAAERKQRLESFGPFAFAILAKTDEGLFAVDPEDHWVGGLLLNSGAFHDHEVEVARSLITESGKVLIVGAHIGAHVVRLSKNCRELVAIEPNPDTFGLLQANVLLNSCVNVKLHNVAASSKTETIRFLKNRENSGGSKREPSVLHFAYVYDDPEIVEIPAVSLDELLPESSFDLIFMDIEGSEYFALCGMQGLLTRCRALSLEFLPHHINDVAGVGIDEFCSIFIDHFEWMYLPGQELLFQGNDMKLKLRTMYETGEGHAGVYFLKNPSSEWLSKLNLTLAV